MAIEQAIFTSAKTAHSAGYQLAAQSAGVTDNEARELSSWGPSHGSLLNEPASSPSVNFFGLTSGRYCVSRTVAAGQEYSERGGDRIYTQCLVVDAETLSRFGNNPFALLRAASAKGVIRVHATVPETLQSFQLLGRSRACDTTAIIDLHQSLGDGRIGNLLHNALSAEVLALTGTSRPDQLFSAVLNCLPVGFRPRASFTTGLVFSARRPFRWLAAPEDRAEQRQLERQYGVKVVDLSRDPEDVQLCSWAEYVLTAIQLGKVNALAAELDSHTEPRDLDAVNALGAQLLSQLASGSTSEARPRSTVASGPNQRAQELGQSNERRAKNSDGSNRSSRGDYLRGHKPHGAAGAVAVAGDQVTRPSSALCTAIPEVRSELQRLDGAVLKLMSGLPAAGDEVKQLWSKLLKDCNVQVREQIREAYMKFATELWAAGSVTGARDADKAAAALDVLCVLFDE